jgi:GNAT superfamily N-acetyltransferase
MNGAISVRFAEPHDFLWCIQVDDLIPQSVLLRKVRHREVLVAAIDGELVGCLRFEYLWSLVPYIAFIWVLFGHRGRGVSRAMLEHLEDHLRREGHQQLLSSSQENEPEPQSWHLHMGFEQCGRIRGVNQGGIDEIFFSKVLVQGTPEPQVERGVRLLQRAAAVASEWSPALEETLARRYPELSEEAVKDVAKYAFEHVGVAKVWMAAHQNEEADCGCPGHPGTCMLLHFKDRVRGMHIAEHHGEEAGQAFLETFEVMLGAVADREAAGWAPPGQTDREGPEDSDT